MNALNIRDIGEARKAALDAEARAQGIPVAELVRRLLDDGLGRTRAARAQAEWLAAAQPGLDYEEAELERAGPSLARYRDLAAPARE